MLPSKILKDKEKALAIHIDIFGWVDASCFENLIKQANSEHVEMLFDLRGLSWEHHHRH